MVTGTEASFSKEEFKKKVVSNCKSLYRKNIDEADKQQVFQSVAYAVKDLIIDKWIATHKTYDKEDPKIVYYMSMEFLMGRALGNNMINLTKYNEIKEALEELGLDINVIEDQEPDAALGNGGLGRLAACFLDSLATLEYPAYGCGIRYKYGMFKQEIKDGYQVEVPDNWLKDGNPFEIKRSEYRYEVKFGGYVRSYRDEATGRDIFVQEDYRSVIAVPYDLPVIGYGNNTVNSLRIWDAEPVNTFNLSSFDKGDYQKAIEEENLAKNIVEVLYPNDNHYAGKELRLKQQYFFVSASVQRAVERYKNMHNGDVKKLYEKVTFQLNDTHPTVAVAELMRVLMDENGLEWDEAWDVTTKTVAYTNHTIMAEALEKWPIELFSRLLPRIYQIVEEINRRFVEDIKAKYPGDQEKVRKMAVIYDGQVKMANLAICGALIFYESPHRIVATLEAVAEVFPQREVAVCRELTKLHEEVLRGPAAQLAEELRTRGEVKGEIALVIAPPSEDEEAGIVPVGAAAADSDEALREDIRAALEEGEPASAVAKRLSQKYSRRKRDVYAMVLDMQ